jgi:trehalose 6-phosphate phosphatase
MDMFLLPANARLDYGDGMQTAGFAVFLDIDGTLIDLAPTPDAVVVPAALIVLLRELAARVDGAIAFVSGRPIAGIDALFQPLQLPAVGVHGVEIRTGDGRMLVDRRLNDHLQRVVPLLERTMAQVPGLQIENKGSAIALHYRSAPDRGREVLQAAEMAVARLGGEFGVLLGKCVVEIRPRHATKGAAIERLMEQPPFQGRTPIFAGDDVTDEDGFAVVNRLGGVSVHIGDSTTTCATCRLADPQQLHDWLRQVGEQNLPQRT